MRFEVVVQRNTPGPAVTVARTRRFAGALSEVERWFDSARANAHTHNPDGRVVEGPTDQPDQWALVSMHPDGTTIVDTVTVVPA